MRFSSLQYGLFCTIGLGLFLKLCAPLFLYDVLLGYDIGVYRYLFTVYGEGLSQWSFPELGHWASSQPLGLFVLTSPLVALGVSVDWLLSWGWILLTLCLFDAFCFTQYKQDKKLLLPFALFLLLSPAVFDGFSAAYIKLYFSLIWMVLTLYLLEKKSLWAIATACLVFVSHLQTSLLLALIVGSLWIRWGVLSRCSKEWRWVTGLCTGVSLLVIFFYLPVFSQAIGQHVPTLFTSIGTKGGSFPPLTFYLLYSCILLFFGAIGFGKSVHDKGLNAWSLAVVWSGIFVVFKLFFFRRFYLLFEFFLLPFCVLGLLCMWKQSRSYVWRGFLVLLLCIQASLSYQAFTLRTPQISSDVFAEVQSLNSVVSSDDTVIVAENITPFFVRGWTDARQVWGPGLLDGRWKKEQWDRWYADELFVPEPLPEGEVLYVYLSSLLQQQHPEIYKTLQRNRCMKPTDLPYVFTLQCNE